MTRYLFGTDIPDPTEPGRSMDPDFRTDLEPMLGHRVTAALTLLYIILLLGACVYSIVWGT